MKKMLPTLLVSLFALGASAALQAQDKAPTAKDETKMDAKGMTGSPDTQSGKMPSDSAGASGSQGAGAAGSPSSSSAMPGAQPDKADQPRRDAKGQPGSPSTQSGQEPGTMK